MKLTRKYMKGLFIVFVLATVWSTFVDISWASNSITPCSWCHQSQTHSWIGSSHQQFSCGSCHQELDWIEMISQQIMGTRKQLPTKVSQEVCLNCHSLRRKETPPGELIVPHDLHNLKTVDCLDCHLNPGHSSRKTTTNATVTMDKCYECHNGYMARDDCQTCHQSIKEDPGHASDTWMTSHGQQALSQFNCQQCHNSTTEEFTYQRQLSSEFSKARRLSSNTKLCRDCHQKRPITHNREFLWKHGHQGENKSGCYVCHPQPQEADHTLAVAKTDCRKCHQQPQHSSNWLKTHKLTIADSGSSACYRCHAPENCGYCHLQQR